MIPWKVFHPRNDPSRRNSYLDEPSLALRSSASAYLDTPPTLGLASPLATPMSPRSPGHPPPGARPDAVFPHISMSLFITTFHRRSAPWPQFP